MMKVKSLQVAKQSMIHFIRTIADIFAVADLLFRHLSRKLPGPIFFTPARSFVLMCLQL